MPDELHHDDSTPTADAAPPPRFLLVEDDPDQTELMQEILRDHFPQAEVVVARSGAEAMQHNLESFSLGILDLHLPDCVGLDLLPKLHGRLPVIMVTGERFGQVAADAIRAGAIDYVVKHGDYLNVVPVVIEKAMAMLEMQRHNTHLENELLARNEELELVNDQLREMAAHDPLTGLYNRRHFEELLGQLFAEATRYGTDLTCMMIDLDRFKQINDTLGHPAGDKVLELTAEVLRKVLRHSDLSARYGGDEFVALLPRTNPADARASARRIVTNFKIELRNRLPNCKDVTLSLGLASIEQGQPPTAEALVRLADQALYLAKAGGKNRIMVISPAKVDPTVG